MCNIFKICVIVFLQLLSIQFVFSQEASVKGVVTNAGNVPMEMAQVALKETGQSVYTDSKGAYSIPNVVPGPYTLVVLLFDYEQVEQSIVVTDGENFLKPVLLTPSAKELNEVIVIGKTEGQKLEEGGFNVNSIETKKFENTNSDVNRILNQSTGVRIRETGGMGSSFNFFLSGLSGKAVKFFVDGQPMEDYGSVFNLNNFPVNLIERVDVYKGAVPVSLGNDAMGGAINIITKKSSRSYLDASYSYGSFNTHRAALTGQWRHAKSGLTVKPQFFYNYSDNNYTMYGLKTIKDKQSAPYIGDFKRFLNSYKSYLGDIQVGFTQKKWADRFFIGLGYGEVNQDVFPTRGTKDPNGSFSIVTPDGARQYEIDKRVSLQYAKRDLFIKGLEVNISSSYNTLNLTTIDTLKEEYNWEGNVVSTNALNNSSTKFNQQMFQQASAVSYQLHENHLLTGSFTWSHSVRQNESSFTLNSNYNYDKFEDPQEIDKKVSGLAYQYTAFKNKLQTTLSGKFYNFMVPSAAENFELDQWSGITKEDISRSRKNLGYGLASRFRFNDNWLVKTSYEKAYRLPEVEEAFGDGMFLLPNLDLLPENSHNVNLGTQFSFPVGRNGKLISEVGAFYRLMQNRIFVSPPASAAFYSYYNIDGVTVKGAEADVRYNFKNVLSVGANATFQDVRNNVEFMKGTNIKNFVYMDRMYNTPVFFANGDISYTLDSLSRKNMRLAMMYNAGYVGEFYLNYQSIGLSATKSTIPAQFVQDIALTLSSANNRYHLTLECRNFMNALAYDNIAMQKPGRAFYVKLRYFLTKS